MENKIRNEIMDLAEEIYDLSLENIVDLDDRDIGLINYLACDIYRRAKHSTCEGHCCEEEKEEDGDAVIMLELMKNEVKLQACLKLLAEGLDTTPEEVEQAIEKELGLD